MTWHLLDVASYQGSLATADVVRAGFDGVNLKTSQGTGLKSVHPDLAGWVTRARTAGLTISTFHYLTADASGTAQAAYAYERLTALGLTAAGHTVDVEEAGVTEAVVRDYLTTMAALRGREVAVYSGRWYWTKGWKVADLAPLLWAAPNAGYPGDYPGDSSAHWAAGYGGWNTLAVMQYAVEPLTFGDGTAGTIKVSKSAVRDPGVWQALTGGAPMPAWTLVPSLVSLRDEFNQLAPARDKASDGSIGDVAHQREASDHDPDDTPGLRTPYTDRDDNPEVHAIDVDRDLRKPGWTMDRAVAVIIGRHHTGRDDRLQYVIWNRKIWSRSWGWTARAYTGPSPHTEHAHFSARYGSGTGPANPENDTRPWGLLEEDDVTKTDFMAWLDEWATSTNGQTALRLAAGVGVHNQKLGHGPGNIGQALMRVDAGVQALTPKSPPA